MPRSSSALAGLVLAVAVAVTACSPATGSSGTAATKPTFTHVHGVGIDPADATVYVASHDGLFRSGPDGLVPAGAAGRDLMGFTVAGPHRFLSSGHPGPGDTLPNPIGLAESTDGGASWAPLSLTGEVDFHALEVAGDTVYGYDATNGLLRASVDGGRTWADRAALKALDIAVDPSDGRRVLATVQGGVVLSTDGGATFTAPAGPPLAFVSWGPDGTIHGLDPGSGSHVSTDGGATWTTTATVPGGRPQAVTATAGGLLAATAGGVFRSVDGGATFTRIA
ncbi:F510_1955 family glycosylhydrolase [Pseudonocardia sp. GCM10023141]|uniref:F510_1955 family glycosylhydrolase n=1 Tax=Pseudonocardia sp. GCM10023141 TaxID=3252653 RepID=UPI00361A4C02